MKVRGSVRSATIAWVSALALLCASAELVAADTVDLTSGSTGSFSPGQSFNETRAVDVTVLSGQDVAISSMTLAGLRICGITTPSPILGARIYDDLGNLLAAANVPPTVSCDYFSISIPISATLTSGKSYRIGFYVYVGSGGSGTFWLPAFPYVESKGWLQINSAWESPADAYPTNTNQAVPQITLDAALIPAVRTLSCSGFESPMDKGPVTAKRNRVLPLKAQLFDGDGSSVTNGDIPAPPVVEILFTATDSGTAVDVTADALSAGLGTTGNQFVYTDSAQWQFNLKTSNYSAPGTYTITMKSGDPVTYNINPTCIAEFVVQ
jgi:hypothetical protein